MKQLSKSYLPEGAVPSGLFALPEKVLQFGAGVLLRGLPDYLIDKANRQGLFNGRIVVVKSTEAGDVGAFAEQDNLYTVCIQGIEHGVEVHENTICSAISRVLVASTQWQTVLDCARNPELEIILSNTTEVGIQYVPESIRQSPPASFPGKLLAFLEARYHAFPDDPNKGMVVVPTELISDNGAKLRSIVLELARFNELEAGFLTWLEEQVTFCNSLVDRIVPGSPSAQTAQILAEKLGFTDHLLINSEPYCLWAIEGNENVNQVLGFHQADPRIVIAPNIDRFRELKLRLLNGTHTLSCGVAFLCRFETVRDAMENPAMARFIERLMLEELAPAIPYRLDTNEAAAFGKQVLDRFRNPFAEHRWLQITVQYSSKMRMRNIPMLLEHYRQFGDAPTCFGLGFAAYLRFMKAEKEENGQFFGYLNGLEYPIQDEQAKYFYDCWEALPAEALVMEVLKNEALWGADLAALPGFAELVLAFLSELETCDPQMVIENITFIPIHQTAAFHES